MIRFFFELNSNYLDGLKLISILNDLFSFMKSPFLLLNLLITSFCFSQRTITGTVSDADGGLLGAIVTVKGSKTYTETDFDGNYFIKASPKDVLVFTYSGYNTKKVSVKNQNEIDVILSTYLDWPPVFFSPEIIQATYGINYETIGLKYTDHYINFPFSVVPTIQYAINFEKNSFLSFRLDRVIYFTPQFEPSVSVQFETANFNKLQYHSYKLDIAAGVHLLKKYNFAHLKLITGFINYDGISNHDNIGLGIGIEKRKLYGFTAGIDLIHWQEFNEFNANASYNWRRWNISGNYKHLANYEEFQVGLGYSFYF